MGLESLTSERFPLKILEVGLGTGLNAWLSAGFAEEQKKKIHYTGVEAFPLSEELSNQVLEVCENLTEAPDCKLLKAIIDADWEKPTAINNFFTLEKRTGKIQEVTLHDAEFDLVYYDAFGPQAQSEMWETAVLEPVVKSMSKGGTLVSYCVQGQFRRNLKSLGMNVKKVPGPPGKREMTRAIKR
jgi:tRNA U34 5-methylaminomethyl-2-thiouridine-forming methyltransferase MnmC